MKTADAIMQRAHKSQYLSHFNGRPLLVLPTAFEAMLAMDFELPQKNKTAEAAAPLIVQPSGQSAAGSIAIIPMNGVMSYKSSWETWWYEISTYEDIRKMFAAALRDESIGGILFSGSSPGGVSAGLFDLVDEIYRARDKKPVWGVADPMAFSACYGILSACSKVYVPRFGQVGSIGCMMGHVNQAGMDEKNGLEYTFIFSGKHKLDFSAHAPLSEHALQEAQKEVDAIRDLFCETVARNRGIKKESVMATEAGLYAGAEAVAAGLADGVMNIDEVLALMKQQIQNNNNSGGKGMAFQDDLKVLLAQGGDETAPALQTLGYVPKSTLAAEQEKVSQAVGEAKTEAEKAERERASGIVEACSLAGLPGEASKLLQEGCTVAQAKEKLIELRAAGSGQGKIIHSTVGPMTIGENAMVEDAQRRAQERRG